MQWHSCYLLCLLFPFTHYYFLYIKPIHQSSPCHDLWRQDTSQKTDNQWRSKDESEKWFNIAKSLKLPSATMNYTAAKKGRYTTNRTSTSFCNLLWVPVGLVPDCGGMKPSYWSHTTWIKRQLTDCKRKHEQQRWDRPLLQLPSRSNADSERSVL
jgi:hypothetical protein